MLAVSATVFVGGVAKANNWSGRQDYYGYFDNKFGHSDSPYPDSKGPVIDNNDYADLSIPYSVNSPQAIYDYLYGKYTNPGAYGHAAWDRAGASFIVNTMLGNDPGASRTVTGAMWNDLHDRLLSSELSYTYTTTVSSTSYGNINTFFQYGNNDVAKYNDPTESGRAIVIKSGGTVVYVLLYKCANPLGNLAGLPEPPHWTISTGTTASKTSSTTTPPLGANEVIPGDTIKWSGTVKNNGPDATDTGVAARFNKSNGWGGTAAGFTIGGGFANGATRPLTYSYTPNDGDLGKTLCASTWAQPHAWNDGGATESPAVCYNVVYRYELHPSVTVGTTAAEAGSNGITVAYDLSNGGPTTSKPTSWQLTQCRYNQGVAVPVSNSEVTNTSNGAATYGAGGTCNVAASGSGTYTAGGHHLGDMTADTGTLQAGSHICYVLSVNPPSATAAGWRHSVLTCITVLKSPKIQALGGDIRADTIATRAATNLGGKYYGSWAEFGIFGFNGIGGIASGASLAGGAATNDSVAQKSLTFANTPTLGSFYSVTPTINAYYDAYKALATAGPGTTGGPVANGTHQIIYVDGSLAINQDITYSGNYTNPDEIPRVIYVVKGNITIADSVTRVDAWLIAKGTLYTCGSDSAPARKALTVNDCKQKLTFNGPVTVAQTRLSRTHGADGDDTNRAEPSEVFNLSPGNYLSNYTASISASNITTVYEKELPPRW